MEVIQKVVRTYPPGLNSKGYKDLQKILAEGYTVAMCNHIQTEQGGINEYIVEKEEYEYNRKGEKRC